VNAVPVSLCRALGAEVVIAVDPNTVLLARRRTPGTPEAALLDFDRADEAIEEGRRAVARALATRAPSC